MKSFVLMTQQKRHRDSQGEGVVVPVDDMLDMSNISISISQTSSTSIPPSIPPSSISSSSSSSTIANTNAAMSASSPVREDYWYCVQRYRRSAAVASTTLSVLASKVSYNNNII